MERIDNSYNSDRGFGDSSKVSDFLARRSGLITAIIIIIIAGGALSTLGFKRVPAGNRGVLLTWGKPEDKILGEGLNFVIPFIQSVELMNVQVQVAESTESAATNDLQEVSATVAVNFRLDPLAVNQIYRELRQDYVSRVIKPNIEESLKAATAKFKAEELITKRATVKSAFDDILAERLHIFDIGAPPHLRHRCRRGLSHRLPVQPLFLGCHRGQGHGGAVGLGS
jgi:regulator of protease activity HflC (stomatin/prohibitin superfamily)